MHSVRAKGIIAGCLGIAALIGLSGFEFTWQYAKVLARHSLRLHQIRPV